MRHLITNYTFDNATRSIVLPDFAGAKFTIENIRLIVNETQKVVICSSMQKDNVISVAGGVITYSEALPALMKGDELTVEVDMGKDIVFVASDWLIERKLETLKPTDQQQEWVLDAIKTQTLKALAETEVNTRTLYAMFQKQRITKADLSPWQSIGGNNCDYLFQGCKVLTEADMRNITSIRGGNYLFDGCTALVKVRLDKLKTISGAQYMFSGCSSLNDADVEFPSLESVAASGAKNFFNGVSLNKLLLPKLKTLGQDGLYAGAGNAVEVYAPEFITGNTQNTDLGGTRTITCTINCASLISGTNYRSPIFLMSNLQNLYLTGEAKNNIFLFSLALNFESVARVLTKLCENTEANGLTCSFKSGFSIADQNGELAALKAKAIDECGWTINNLTIK